MSGDSNNPSGNGSNAFSVLMSSASKSNWKKSTKKVASSSSKTKSSGKKLLSQNGSTANSAVSSATALKGPTPRKLNYGQSRPHEEQYAQSLATYVACPICNEKVKATLINHHLDLQCEVACRSARNAPKKRPLTSCTSTVSKEDEITVKKNRTEQRGAHNDEESSSELKKMFGKSTKHDNPFITPSETPTRSAAKNSNIDVFTHMMNHARRFSSAKSKSKTFIFHLQDDQNYTTSWINANELGQTNEFKSSEKWSSSVVIKGSEVGVKHELIISSSVPSAIDESLPDNDGIYKMKPLVKRHSKLSVPVLKSSLQKAIRRKRPLPAVRTAMELMDKSFESFIRRLPIIILEDSTLHPDYPLLIWLMIAASKNFLPPKALVLKLMKIVFEVAFCSLKDDLIEEEAEEATNMDMEFDICLEDNISNIGEKEALMLRSMILRRQYGGMKCDKEMLHKFVHRWKQRYSQAKVKEEISQRCFQTQEEIKWIQVPYFSHMKGIEISAKFVPPLLMGDKLVFSLEKSDITAAAIDFHCTNVLDFILQKDDVYSKISATILAICEKETTLSISMDGPVTLESLMAKLKWCMWTFSSGINFKRSLAGSCREDTKKLPLYKLWAEEVEPYVNAFATKYVNDRLVSVK